MYTTNQHKTFWTVTQNLHLQISALESTLRELKTQNGSLTEYVSKLEENNHELTVQNADLSRESAIKQVTIDALGQKIGQNSKKQLKTTF